MLQLEHLQLISQSPYAGLWLIAAFPLAGSVLNGLLTLGSVRGFLPVPRLLHGIIACVSSIFSFLVAWEAFLYFKGLPENTILTQDLLEWVESASFHVRIGLQLDSLSMVMTVFITFVSSFIHIYSIGYMKGDPGFGRYFTYLNLFLFSMLTLVLADGFLLMFLGWEGVGFCSYLLISFWFEDREKADAGKKAIIVNRIGDAGFLMGILMVFAAAGTLNFNELLGNKQVFSEGLATAVCLCFFLGAVGKSAQIPLYVWLPDAMAGPTPVSALIHAATMVTAGVYLVARLHFLYVMAPWASALVSVIGVLTALLAATVALVQTDIKKVLAYSTISQLGLMFLGVGAGGYAAGIFHLVTHGFFKATLFLGAGSVIHALKGEQDIRKMGGLLKHLPLTGISFLTAWLAISGIPPFSGFFSKDEILWRVLATPNRLFALLPDILYFSALLTSFLTAFYMTRLVALVFFGDYRGAANAYKDIHESPRVMLIPLGILALGSLFIGWIGVPETIGGGNGFARFLEPLFHLSTLGANALSLQLQPLFMLISVVAAGLGIGGAWYLYALRRPLSSTVKGMVPEGTRLLERKYFVDEIYEVTVVRWVRGFAEWVSKRFIEDLLINRGIEGLTRLFYALAGFLRKSQVGLVRAYLAYVLAGATVLIYWMLR